MRTSSSFSPEDRTRRTAPRRHAEAEENVLAAQYDSEEFPVLIRMPDLSSGEEAAVTSGVAQQAQNVEEPAISEDAASTSKRHRRHRRPPKEEALVQEKAFTSATASARFWGRLAPKAAVGGILLLVTVLCVVVIQKPGQYEPKPEVPSGWAGQSKPPVQATNESIHESNPTPFPLVTPSDTPSKDSSLAVKPEPRSAVAPPWDNSAHENHEPVTKPLEKNPGSDQEFGNAWPADTVPEDAAADPTPVTDKPYRADRWPDDYDLSGENSGSEAELELNPAAKSAQRAVRPRMPFAARDSSPLPTPNSQGNSTGARLLGTVEIPNPRTDFRR